MKTLFSIFLNPIIILFILFCFSTNAYSQECETNLSNTNASNYTCNYEDLLEDEGNCAIAIPNYGNYFSNGLNYQDPAASNYDFLDENGNNDIDAYLPGFGQVWDDVNETMISEWFKINIIMRELAVPVGYINTFRGSNSKWEGKIGTGSNEDNYTTVEFSIRKTPKQLANLNDGNYFEMNNVVYEVINTIQHIVPGYESECANDVLPFYDEIWGYNGDTLQLEEIPGQGNMPADNPFRNRVLYRYDGSNYLKTADEIPSEYVPYGDHAWVSNQTGSYYNPCGPMFEKEVFNADISGDPEYCSDQYPEFKCKWDNVEEAYVTNNPFAVNNGFPCAIYGCMDDEALNYNKYATHESGDCSYPGCADSNAENYVGSPELIYNFQFFFDDSGQIVSSHETIVNDNDGNNYDIIQDEYDFEYIYEGHYCKYEGCTDSNAFNYNVDANQNDGSCEYYGCWDDDAFNTTVINWDIPEGGEFIPDGTCQDKIYGCTDDQNCNYDPEANTLNEEDCIYQVTTITIGSDGLAANYYNDYNGSGQGAVILSWESKHLDKSIGSYEIYRVGTTSPIGSSTQGSGFENANNNSSGILYNSDENRQYFVDQSETFINCNTYGYYIVALSDDCYDGSKLTSISETAEVLIDENISFTWVDADTTLITSTSSDFLAQKQLFVSQGNYEDKIQLSWSNNNNSFIRSFEILRRPYHPDGIYDFIAIDEVSNQIHHYIDENVVTEYRYDYKVKAYIQTCQDDFVEDVYLPDESWVATGFCVGYSDIYGRVTFEESLPVDNVEVLANPLNTTNNFSLYNSGGYGFPLKGENQTVNSSSIDTNSFSLMTWINLNDDGPILTCKPYSSSPFLTIELGWMINEAATWTNIALSYDHLNTELNMYVNGMLHQTINSDFSDFSDFYLGYFDGYLDELSLWNKALDSNFIAENYNRYLNNQEEGLIGYYHFDEGNGQIVYDYSIGSNGVHNYNHIDLNRIINPGGQLYYSSDIPNDILYSALTDENGYYVINQLRTPNFAEISEVIPFDITPTRPAIYSIEANGDTLLSEPAHEFLPSSTQMPISGGNNVSEINFTDVSSFELNGVVYFIDPSGNGNPTYDEDSVLTSITTSISTAEFQNGNSIRQNLGVEGVAILIDNEFQFDTNGDTILTNADGTFKLAVPIGRHQISVVKQGHTFVEDIWNSSDHTIIEVGEAQTVDYESLNTFNFTNNFDGVLEFYDNTKRTLVGRVCGGPTEASKLYDGSSINNIGVTRFTISSGGDHSTIVETDPTTGEFIVDLLPLKYNIFISPSSGGWEFEIYNNTDADNFFTNVETGYLGRISDIDLTGNIIPSSDQTFLKLSDGTTSQYHYAQNFVYRKTPEIEIYTDIIEQDNLIEQKILGETQWNILNMSWDESNEEWVDGDDISIPLISSEIQSNIYTLGIPVFKKSNLYAISPIISENYYNYDQFEVELYKDIVSEGSISFNDGNKIMIYEMDSNFSTIPYIPSEVNTSLDNVTNSSFQKSFTVTYNDLEGIVSAYEPYNFYVFGSAPDEGLNFFTSGPEVVEMVLRDPPGDKSYSFINEGSVQTSQYSVTDKWNFKQSIGTKINFGGATTITFPTGGPVTLVEPVNNLQINISADETVTNVEENTHVYSTNLNYSTSSQEYNIGSGGDLYIAKNFNMLYGTNRNLEIINVDQCVNEGVVCLGEEDLLNPSEASGASSVGTLNSPYENYTVGYYKDLEIAPVGFPTKSVYSQNHITQLLIPQLKWLRNIIISTAPYELTNSEDPCFDNESHSAYNDTIAPYNLTPCYTYNDLLDASDPFESPFNVFDDLNLEDHLLAEFVEIVKSALEISQINGVFTGFDSQTLETMTSIVSSAEVNSGALAAVTEALDNSFWSQFTNYIGGVSNMFNGLETFKDNVLDYFSGLSDVFDEDILGLIEYLDGIQETPINDKVAWFNQQINLWEKAIRKNEEDKSSIFDDSGLSTSYDPFTGEVLMTYGPDHNYSISAGNSVQETSANQSNHKDIHTISYNIDGNVVYKYGMKIQGIGTTGIVGPYQLKYTFDDKTNTSTSSSTTFGYVLFDNDEGDYLSIDVKNSNVGWGPIFRKRAGATKCPHESEEPFLYYQNDDADNLFSESTQPREVPSIDIYPQSIEGVPESEQAIFTLSLTNNSATNQDIVYTLMTDQASNPHGAILRVDGLNPNRTIMVPAGETITKTLTVNKGPEWLNYSDSTSLPEGGGNHSLGLILRSSCQYSYGISNTPDIADSVYFQVSFTPECSDISLNTPIENWVYNSVSDAYYDGGMNIQLADYNWNYYSLEDIILQYKPTNSSTYSSITNFLKVPETTTDQLIDPSGITDYVWDLGDLPDGAYDIRAYTKCGDTYNYSEVHSGVKDILSPELFGAPQPADGILSSNDEIQINWSEQIDENVFYANPANTSLYAIKNLSEVSHDAYVFFDEQSSLNIPYGLNLQNTSFTIEMWLSPSVSGKLFEQGYNNNRASIFVNNDNTLRVQYEVSGEVVTANSTSALSMDGSWQHVAFVFDNDQKTMSFIINGTLDNTAPFLVDYDAEGAISIGGEGYIGGIHELRIWSSTKHYTKIYQNMGLRLSGNTTGLKGYWPMDELQGSPQDYAQSRHMSGDVNWTVSKKGHGYNFGSEAFNYLQSNTIDFFYDALDNFTIEFWFKSEGINECMLSSGSYDPSSTSGNLDGWSLGLDGQGHISIDHNLNNGSNLLMTSNSPFNDGLWHHLALVKDAKSNTSLYIDQIEQASCSSELTRGFLTSNIVLGAKRYSDANGDQYSLNFGGKMDDIRIWNLKRSVDQLSRYQNIRLDGNELGLDLYYPFEEYVTQSGAILLLDTYNDIAGDNDLNIIDTSNTDSFESEDLPIITMTNPYQQVFFESVVNQDKIILSITDDIASVEGVIVDATMDNIKDLYGNGSEPQSWSFYVDRNQLTWSESNIEVEKLIGDDYTFETDIINMGGSIESFQITNLPTWLTAYPSEGLINPNSSTEIQFLINESIFIGDYDCQIELIGNNEFAEILNLDINVHASQPEILFSDQNYQYSMNFIGKVLVDGIRSRDELDVLIAYVDDQVRGYASPTYIEEYDAYIIFLTAFSNEISGDTIKFRLWDASEGKFQSQVIAVSNQIDDENHVEFSDGGVLGNFNSLVSFETNNILRQEIPLNAGWNWVSMNLEAQDSSAEGEVMIPTVTNSLNENAVQIIKGQEEYYQYTQQTGWLGTNTNNSLQLTEMYKVNMIETDTLIYEGEPVDLSNSLYHININSGWNWIGYLGQRPLEINEALSSMNASDGDVIKSKNHFSMYASESMGWLGTLNTINEGQGYMLNSSEEHVLIYPESSLYGSNNFRLDNNIYVESIWHNDQNKYENSMNIIAKIDDQTYDYPKKDNVLASFKVSECTGNINSTEIDDFTSLYFLTVHGNEGDEVAFKYYDYEEEIILNAFNKLTFKSDQIIGSINDPYLIQIDRYNQEYGESFYLNIIPNPVSSEFEIEFYLEDHSNVRINISDVTGRLIHKVVDSNYQDGIQKININSSHLSSGIYILDCNINGINSQYKLVKN